MPPDSAHLKDTSKFVSVQNTIIKLYTIKKDLIPWDGIFP